MRPALGWVAPERMGRAPHSGVRTASAGGLSALRPEVLIDHLPPVYDQGAVGSCTAQALALAVEALLPRAGYAAERPDRRALYWRERREIGTVLEDSGAIIADGVRILADEGWEREAHVPELVFDGEWIDPPAILGPTAPRLVSSEALDFDDATFATELDAGHVVVVGLSVTEQWQRAWGTVALDEPGGLVIGGHAVALVGYSIPQRCWVVRNSWGAQWGTGGNVLLPWAWTQAPWCGEAHALRAVRRVDGPKRSLGDEKREMLDALSRGDWR